MVGTAVWRKFLLLYVLVGGGKSQFGETASSRLNENWTWEGPPPKDMGRTVTQYQRDLNMEILCY